MIDTLLDFTRVRVTGKPLPIAQDACDYADVLRDIVEESSVASPEQPIELEIRGDTRGVCDAQRIAEAVSNLLSNAIKYGDSTKPIRVSLEGDANAITLGVHNEGSPIPEGLMPVLFEPFARGHSEADSRQGMGMGLFVVKEIVTSHGGHIEVESIPQAGTTFTLHIPRAGSA
jgi:signal transduction histidine kinase